MSLWARLRKGRRWPPRNLGARIFVVAREVARPGANGRAFAALRVFRPAASARSVVAAPKPHALAPRPASWRR
jgi:hypothetical protein